MSGKRTAKDNEELSDEDHQTIATIVLGWVFFWNMLMKMTPEECAEKVFLKIGKSKKKPSIIRLLFDLIREKANPIRSPDEFNQKLAREMLVQSLENVAKDSTLESRSKEQFRRYLDRRRMFEVLLYLRDKGVLKHLKHKETIRKEMHRLPGRVGNHSFDTYSERFGGKPSADLKTYKMESISILLQKPKARTQVYEALKETNILYDNKKFMLSAFFIALKRSKRRDIHKTILSVKVIMKATNNTPIETWKIESLVNHIVNHDENQLKSFAAERAKESVQIQKDDSNFLMGLFRF